MALETSLLLTAGSLTPEKYIELINEKKKELDRILGIGMLNCHNELTVIAQNMKIKNARANTLKLLRLDKKKYRIYKITDISINVERTGIARNCKGISAIDKTSKIFGRDIGLFKLRR